MAVAPEVQAAIEAAVAAAMASLSAKESATPEREYEIGEDEAWKANMKMMFDEFLNAGTSAIKANALFVSNAQQEYQTHIKNQNNLAMQAQQNAIESANALMKQYLESNAALTKQHLAHRDVATDRTWNVDEQGFTVAEILNNQTFKDAISAAAAQTVQAMIPTIVSAVGDAVKAKVA